MSSLTEFPHSSQPVETQVGITSSSAENDGEEVTLGMIMYGHLFDESFVLTAENVTTALFAYYTKKGVPISREEIEAYVNYYAEGAITLQYIQIFHYGETAKQLKKNGNANPSHNGQ
ncbi:hypothetical protein HY468_05240 [Candidatus Roizmanbacteria bacterium]|nr:hypothetical protein [Candidatus Roizmanbacteria bacterium]